MSFKDLKDELIQLKGKATQSRTLLFAVFTAAGILALIASCKSQPKPTNKPNADSVSVDTYIPAGYVLVPIELENYQALDSILGSFGTVDLFSQPVQSGARAEKIATQIKILRAPLNPSHFAVLVREDEAPAIVKHPGSFFAVIQNPAKNGTRIEKDRTRKPTSRIFVEGVE